MSDARVAIASVASKPHLARARVLAQSLRSHHPELSFTLLLVDEPEGRFDPTAEPFEIVRLEEIAHRDLIAQLRGLPDVGSCSMSMKAALLEHLLARGHRAAVHLDTDMLLTARIDPLLAALDDAAVVLTPHVLAPPCGPGAALWRWALRIGGVVNSGVVGVRGDARGTAFLRWWGDRVARSCAKDPANGVFYDQRWLDLSPALLDGVTMLRDPGTNVAVWNIAERPLSRRDGVLNAGAQPCRLVHFAGYDPSRPRIVCTYVPDFTVDVAGELGVLAGEYHAALLAAGWAQTSQWPWAYAGQVGAGG